MIMVRPGGTEQIFAPETDRTVVALSTEDVEAIAPFYTRRHPHLSYPERARLGCRLR